jgi:NAD(P)-dependent dehydrogenase (short-subunit alcohol dehydrogenase family)
VRDLRDKVAVIAGGASGIGLALAECFAALGMKLALADIESEPLEAAARRLTAQGAEVLAVPTDLG